MTQLQEIEFDILKNVIQICDCLGLKYYLVCGSALGAVKYQGFIPWDDDVDIALCRDDYKVFCEKASEYLPKNLFLQTNRTDLNYPQIFCKVRNSETTYIESSVRHIDMNHGAYIDVFPLDGYPKDIKKQRCLEIKKAVLHYQQICAYEMPNNIKFYTKVLIKMERIFGFDRNINKTVQKMEKVLSKYKTDNSDIWCNHGNWQGKLEYASCKQYGNGTWVVFEGLRVRIPEDYDAYLTQKYGDWRADLPKEQQISHHFAEIIDLNRPYTDFIEKLPNGRIRIKKPE